ncbi:TAXI family TRAP transporter solute-binding subunit [Fusobacterium russii]|uniref:TAXI family TRAP transporter solute-binding subunit n=1 Tax=Fusobacterium russii TaxID=854 RepID=UPI0003A27140|nr:TAXI family TRAP transporter solute-binding subunit [Fusobacterium russii]
MKLLKKSFLLVVIFTLFTAILACGKSEEKKDVAHGIDRSKEFITIATGPTSGIYFPIGGAFAEALKTAGYNTSSQATGASAENISMISKGEAEIAIAMQDSVMQAYGGFGAYEGKPNPELKALMRLWPNYVQLVTLKKSGIKSVEDLKGKRVGVGAANSGVELNARMIYEAYGMTYEDSKVDYLSYGEAIDQMKNGQCDAAFVTSGLPNGTIMELATSYDMEIVPIDGAGRDKLIEKYPFFSKTIVPANTYNNDKDVESVFVYNIMLVNSKLSDDVVYDMINVIFENIATIKASHNAANKNIDLSFGVEDVKIPLHPGAAKFWQEKGFATPNN